MVHFGHSLRILGIYKAQNQKTLQTVTRGTKTCSDAQILGHLQEMDPRTAASHQQEVNAVAALMTCKVPAKETIVKHICGF